MQKKNKTNMLTITINYGGPEGSLTIAFLFKRFLCLSDLFLRFVSAILFRRFVSNKQLGIFIFSDHYI